MAAELQLQSQKLAYRLWAKIDRSLRHGASLRAIARLSNTSLAPPLALGPANG